MDFVTVDVETANPDLGSICQVGVTLFENCRMTDFWSSLVDPEDYFDGFNIDIHGIEPTKVRGAPTWPIVFEQLDSFCAGKIVASHMPFDRTAISRACSKYDINQLDVRWLDTARVVRRTWPEFAQRGYGLRNVADFLEIEFNHHDALEDARAAGEILVAAIRHTGLDVEHWSKRALGPISGAKSATHARDYEPNPEGPLFGETIVFTGTLNIPRPEASQLAAEFGCVIGGSVTKRTTLLVVGDQDIRVLKGHEKSSKHRKAEELIAKGQQIRIIQESDFAALVSIQP